MNQSALATTTVLATPAVGLPTRVVWLLAIAVFINYVDRGTLATAAPLIKDELRLTNAEMGMLLSAFFWSYTPLQLVAGWLAQRVDVRYVYAGGLAMWSGATALTGIVSGFAALLVLRVLVGIGESVAMPCNSKMLADGLPEHRRGWANGLVSTGFGLGPAFGTLVGGVLMAQFGWRIGFLAFGVASLLWLWPWMSATRGVVLSEVRGSSTAPVSYLEILRERSAWGASLGHFCSNYGIYFVLTWLPLYLVKARGLSVAEMSVVGASVYGIYAASSALTGWVSDRWLSTGASVNRVRKTMIVAGMLGAAACLLLSCLESTPVVSVTLLMGAATFFGFVSPQLFSIAQTLSGPRAAGQWMGLQNTIGNFAGILAPLITGIIVDSTGRYVWAFAIVGVVLLLGSVAWGLIIKCVEPVRW